MRDQLEALGELARFDVGGRRLEVEREDIRVRLGQLDGELDRMRELLERERKSIVEAETMIKTNVSDIEDLAERVNRSTVRHNHSKNQRERDATQRELDVLRREKDERNSRAGELDKTIIQMRESAARHTKDLETLREALAVERQEAEKRLGEIEVEREKQRAAREGSAKKIRPDLLRKYNAIRERRSTSVAEVVEGVCRGCNISLPPQFIARLRDMKEILQCPNCNRILLIDNLGTGG